MKSKNAHESPDEIPMRLLNARKDLMEQYVVDPEHYGKAIRKVVSDADLMGLIEKSLEDVFRDYWPVFKSAQGLSVEKEMVRWIGGNVFHFLYEQALGEIEREAWMQAKKEFGEGVIDEIP